MIGAALALVALDIVFNVYDIAGDKSIRRIFNVAREESLPTWFASSQALLVGLAAWMVAWHGHQHLSAARRYGWIGVGTFFTYLSADDASEIHERLGSAIGRVVEAGDSTVLAWFPSFAWQLFIAPILALSLLASVLFLSSVAHTRTLRFLPLVALGIFAVSQSLDFIEGIDGLYSGWADQLGWLEYSVSHSFRMLEEFMEMLATSLLGGCVWSAMDQGWSDSGDKKVSPPDAIFKKDRIDR